MQAVFESLLPIVLLTAAGAALLRGGFYTNTFRRDLDRLVYWIALPCLIVAKLSASQGAGSDAVQVGLVLAGATGTAIGVGYLLAWGLKLPAPCVGVLVQAGLRGNLAFVGLPVIVLADGEAGRASALAVLVLAPMVVVYNVLSVLALQLAQHRLTWQFVPRLAWSLLGNPLILACALGMGLGALEVALPGPIHRALDVVGQTAGPLALLSLGGSLVVYSVREHLLHALAGSLVKVVWLPAAAWVLGQWAGLASDQMLVLMVFASTPTAVASYVLTSQLGGDEGLSASCIVLSTLLCAISLAIVLASAAREI